MATGKVRNYFDVSFDDTIGCPACGWEGCVGDEFEPRDEAYEVRCAECNGMLLIVPYPTVEEVKAAAAAGNERAVKGLPTYLKREQFIARYEKLKLKPTDELPELGGGALAFEWDLVADEREELWTVIRFGEREIWREPAVWEGHERFAEVEEILRRRYGPRFHSLTPTERSEKYLYGDSWASISTT